MSLQKSLSELQRSIDRLKKELSSLPVGEGRRHEEQEKRKRVVQLQLQLQKMKEVCVRLTTPVPVRQYLISSLGEPRSPVYAPAPAVPGGVWCV